MTGTNPSDRSMFETGNFRLYSLFMMLMVLGLTLYALIAGRLELHDVGFIGAFIALNAARGGNARIMDRKVSVRIEDRREAIGVLVMPFGSILLPVISYSTPLLSFADYDLPLWTFFAGVAVAALGVWVVSKGHRTLGANWAGVLELRQGHELVTDGIFARTRNPIYLGFFLMNIAQILFIGNWIAGFSGIVGFTFMYLRRIPREEKMLADAFGADWEAYAKAVPRLIPLPGKKAA